MTSTTPVRRLAAGATTALLALGLLTPAALAVADELPVEDQTTTVLDEAAAVSDASAEPSAEPESAPEPTAPADESTPPTDEPVPATDEQAPADTAASPVAAPAPAAAEASLAESLVLAAGERRTFQIAVTAATNFQAYALGADFDLAMTLPAGSPILVRPADGVARNMQIASSPQTGTLTVTVVNNADTMQVIPLVIGSWGPSMQPRYSLSLKQTYLNVSVNPLVDGVTRTDLTGQLTVIGADGFGHTIALRPQTTGSTAYYGRFDDLAPGDYLVEVRIRVDGVEHASAAIVGVSAADTTPPAVAYTTEPAASNAHGWFRRAVSATLAASDTGTGVWKLLWALGSDPYTTVYGNTATVDLTTEGIHSLTSYAEDYQQNASAENTRTVRIDLTAPTATLDGLVDGQEITEGDEVTVDYSCGDALSGIVDCIAPIESGEQLDTATPGVYTFTLIAVDRAGNDTRIERSYTVVGVDTTAPSLDVEFPEEPASGWYTEPVTLQFSASDLETGISRIHWEYGTGSGVVIGSSEQPTAELELTGTGVYTVEVWAEDGAGNRSETQTYTLRVDLLAPAIQLVSPVDPIVSILPNGHYAQHERVVVDFSCTDRGSGVDACDATTPAGELLPTGTPGTHELRIVATDVAGNRTERVLSYTVDAAAGPGAVPTASRDPRLAQTGAETVIPGIILVAVLLAAGATLLTTRRLGGR